MGELVVNRLLEKLGNPQAQLRCVHVAGTNGKGSVSAMLASILQQAGYKTGLYTSPHLRRFNERIRVNGEEIPDAALEGLQAEVQRAADALVAEGGAEPAYFDLATAAGFLHFQRSGCDIVVLEVGLGGRLDATNAIPCPDCAVITHIGLDHTELLGDTLEQIAAEKGGIIKPGGDVVLYGQAPGVEAVIAQICRERGSRLTVADGKAAVVHAATLEGTHFSYRNWENLYLPLLGRYQTGNAVTVLEVVERLREKGWQLTDEQVRAGLSAVRWPGRLELLHRAPDVLLDGAHNPQGTAALTDSLRALFPGRKITFVMGSFADKDYAGSIELAMPLARRFYAITPHSDRALTSAQLAEEIERHTDSPVLAYRSIPEALDAALGDAGAEDVICIFGSLYQVSEVEDYFTRTNE